MSGELDTYTSYPCHSRRQSFATMGGEEKGDTVSSTGGLPKRFSQTMIIEGAVVVSREFLNRANVLSRPVMRCIFDLECES